ncbi:GlxA family transcriptional regulator [Pseudodesulfovibrio sediminis]|uniref:AraC family transcriptional regulator n=1 Tax=Pseudodesulfovibrio sediminis TaxID=2810563 RepID=A0ABM8HWE6_9BACT|nr:helix-turn-helix domain-containing protein [Pseudodesulfovibrio sediminis]BCS87258.1 AraC family transcriptional regulator [Pseudodesulfovibrio sediminis]
MVQIDILSIPGCLNSAVSGIGEILTLSNTIAKADIFQHAVRSVYGQSVQSFTGESIEPVGQLADASPDILILPPLLNSLDEVLSMREIINWLSAFHASGGVVVTICAGAFLLAETGLLDGRAATTHWNLVQDFKNRYPSVDLQAERLLIDGGDYICAGGISAWMDLSLHLVTRHAGRDIARACAKMMLMDPQREYQTPYGMGGFRRNHGDDAVLASQKWLDTQYSAVVRIKDMAEIAALGERTFLRRFRAATGITPANYIQQIRVEAAQNLLETTSLGVEEIADSVGYGDDSTFRKLFKRIMGCTPSAYRQRYSALNKKDGA